MVRPLIVVTGALKVDGHGRDRGRADVIRSDVLRKLRKVPHIDTPFGRLFDPRLLLDLIKLFDGVTRDVSGFNRKAQDCTIVNGYVWEHLSGNRLAAVEGWAYLNDVDLDAPIKGGNDGEEKRA